MHSKEPIDNFQAYLRDLWDKTSQMPRRRVDWEQAAAQIDMTNHRSNFAQLTSPGVDPRRIKNGQPRVGRVEDEHDAIASRTTRLTISGACGRARAPVCTRERTREA